MNIVEKKYSEPARWICVYPAFLNSKKTLAEGRCLPKEKAVENPTVTEMMEALSSSGLKACPENKQYSRERSKEFAVRGRIKVQIKNDDGTFCNPSFTTRKSIMLYMCNIIPKLKSRTSKPAEHIKETTKKKGKGRK